MQNPVVSRITSTLCKHNDSGCIQIHLPKCRWLYWAMLISINPTSLLGSLPIQLRNRTHKTSKFISRWDLHFGIMINNDEHDCTKEDHSTKCRTAGCRITINDRIEMMNEWFIWINHIILAIRTLPIYQEQCTFKHINFDVRLALRDCLTLFWNWDFDVHLIER